MKPENNDYVEEIELEVEEIEEVIAPKGIIVPRT